MKNMKWMSNQGKKNPEKIKENDLKKIFKDLKKLKGEKKLNMFVYKKFKKEINEAK